VFVDFNPDYLLHLGARTDTFERRSLDGYAANVQGVRNVIAAANASRGLRRIIMTSSRLVCPIGYLPKSDDDFCPPNLYGQSKVETERITKATAIRAEWLITRPTAIWGPGFMVPSYRDFFEQIRRGRYFHLGSSNPRKTFGYVKNFSFQMEKLLEAPQERVQGRIFYVGDYEPVSLRDWADLIAREFGRRPVLTVPLGLLRAAAFGGDLLKKVKWDNAPLTSYRLGNMLSESVHDCTALAALTGPLPHDLESATRETVAWLKNNP
jgi:nucleoside-diphosphate-sugar epimerase